MSKHFFILYGSQTGCAESIAKGIHDLSESKGFSSTLFTLNQAKTEINFSDRIVIVVICSTTGNGDPPDNADAMWRHLRKRAHPKDLLKNVSFTVLGLGDTNYDQFCKMGKSLNKRLEELGAKRFYDFGAADEGTGIDVVVEPWMEGLWAALRGILNSEESRISSVQMEEKSEEVLSLGSTHSISIAQTILSFSDIFSQHTLESIKDKITNTPAFRQCPIIIEFLDKSITTVPQVCLSLNEIELQENQAGSSKDHPFPARIVSARYLTKKEAIKQVIEIVLDISESNLTYIPGDSIGILCPNDDDVVDNLISRLGLNGNDVISIQPPRISHIKSPTTIREVFQYCCDITSTMKKAFLRMLAEFCTEEIEKQQLLLLSSRGGKEEYESFIEDQRLTLLELLVLFPSCKPTIEHLIYSLPPLPPRYYSVSSSPLKSEKRISIALSVVQYLTKSGHQRYGLCSNWLKRICEPLLTESSTSVSQRIAIFMRPTREFRLPSNTKYPIVMVGPGTGVAPFLGFIQHRHIQFIERSNRISDVCTGTWRGGFEIDCVEDDEFVPENAQGPMVLFFGCRNRALDFLYEEELTNYTENDTLTELHTAFSRDQIEKDYVQHHIHQHSDRVFDLLVNEGGYFYVCGDGSAMAKDVHECLLRVLEDGGMSQNEAREYVEEMIKRSRYVRDIWS